MKQRTRLAAYVVAVDTDRLLLARIAPGYPGAGRWTLPGGGVEFGEHPEDALEREVYEESGFAMDSFVYLGIDSRLYPARDDRGELHAIRMIYSAELSGTPKVTEVNGSVDTAQWIPFADLDSTDTVDLVAAALHIAGVR